MPEIKDILEPVTKSTRDAAYVVVGLGVLAFQRAQVRRQELAKKLAEPKSLVEDRIGDVRGQITKQVQTVDAVVEQVIDRIEASLEPIEERLPAQAKDLVKNAHIQARDARQQLRNLISNAA